MTYQILTTMLVEVVRKRRHPLKEVRFDLIVYWIILLSLQLNRFSMAKMNCSIGYVMLGGRTGLLFLSRLQIMVAVGRDQRFILLVKGVANIDQGTRGKMVRMPW